LNLLATSFAAGIFSAASRVTLLFALMVSGLGSVVNSRFSTFDTKEKITSYIKKLLLFISGIAALMSVCVLFASPIIKIVYGPDYIEAVPVFQAMTIAMIPFLFSLVTTPAIIYTYNRPDFYAKISALQVLLIIAIEVSTISRFSYFAPVIALGTTNVLILIISGMKLRSLIYENKIMDRR
jgi:O-antigen/teichoic acid export membrane protein